MSRAHSPPSVLNSISPGRHHFDPQTGHEFSAVISATYNLINPATQYKNGIDGHLDWGASQFLSASLQVGAVGYVYDQLTGDSGSGAKLGPFESRVIGIGPQIGYLFPVAGMQGYVNLKAYGEFDAPQPAVRLERMADVFDFAGPADKR